jgi:hypothetical protein
VRTVLFVNEFTEFSYSCYSFNHQSINYQNTGKRDRSNCWHVLYQRRCQNVNNRDHSPNFFRQTSLLFHKWLAERFNLDDAWIVSVGYKNTSISNALITWIGKFCKFVHKQNCSHDFFLLYTLLYSDSWLIGG